MSATTGKTCRGCGEVMSLDQFSPDASRGDRLHDKCRRCSADRARLRYHRNAVEMRHPDWTAEQLEEAAHARIADLDAAAAFRGRRRRRGVPA